MFASLEKSSIVLNFIRIIFAPFFASESDSLLLFLSLLLTISSSHFSIMVVGNNIGFTQSLHHQSYRWHASFICIDNALSLKHQLCCLIFITINDLPIQISILFQRFSISDQTFKHFSNVILSSFSRSHVLKSNNISESK